MDADPVAPNVQQGQRLKVRTLWFIYSLPIREDINNGSYKLSTNRCQVQELEAASVMFIPFWDNKMIKSFTWKFYDSVHRLPPGCLVGRDAAHTHPDSFPTSARRESDKNHVLWAGLVVLTLFYGWFISLGDFQPRWLHPAVLRPRKKTKSSLL